MEVNEVSGVVVDSAMKVHSALGPGLLESAYEMCLVRELRKRGLRVESQVPVAVRDDGETLDVGYRADLLVEGIVLVELKSVEVVLPIHKAQLLSYLRLSRKEVGLLINFNVEHLKDGIKRVITRDPDSLWPQRPLRCEFTALSVTGQLVSAPDSLPIPTIRGGRLRGYSFPPSS